MVNRIDEIADRLESPDSYIRELAIKELQGDNSEKALTLLFKRLEDEEWRIRKIASSILIEKGDIVVKSLQDKMKYNQNDDFVYWSCQILSKFGISTLPILKSYLNSDKKEHKYYAVMALNNISDKKIIDILINCLSDSYWLVRKEAAEGLEKFGNFAISKLQNYVSSGNKDLRYWTIKLIGKVLKESAVDILLKAMNHKDKEMRYHTVIALGEANNEKAIPILIKALSDSSWLVRKQAAECIVDYGEKAVKYLQEAFKKGNADVKYWTIKLFGRILKDSGVEYLNKILTESSETDMRYYAITALGEVKTNKAIMCLIEALKDESWTLRRHIANVLKNTGAIVIPVIKKFIYKEHKDEDILYWSANILADLGVESIDSLEQILKYDNKNVKLNAINAFGEILSAYHESEAVVYRISDILIETFNDRFWIVRKNTYGILKSFITEIAPQLLVHMGQGNPDLDYWGNKLLNNSGKKSVEKLMKILSAPDTRGNYLQTIRTVENYTVITSLMEAIDTAEKDLVFGIFEFLKKSRGEGLEYLKNLTNEYTGKTHEWGTKIVREITMEMQTDLQNITLYQNAETDDIFEFFLNEPIDQLMGMQQHKVISLITQLMNIRSGFIHSYISEFELEPVIRAVKDWIGVKNKNIIQNRMDWLRKKAKYYMIYKDQNN